MVPRCASAREPPRLAAPPLPVLRVHLFVQADRLALRPTRSAVMVEVRWTFGPRRSVDLPEFHFDDFHLTPLEPGDPFVVDPEEFP